MGGAAILAGWGGAGPAFAVTPEQAAQGGKLYARSCALCHGGGAPDLRASTVPLSRPDFADVVIRGARAQQGMPAFPDLTDADLDGLESYIRTRARESLQAAAGGEERGARPN